MQGPALDPAPLRRASPPPGLDLVREILARSVPDTGPSEAATRRAAVAMVLREAESGLEALLIKRAEHPLDPWSGHMAFPGGHQDPEDESLEAAARRETLEEVGLALTPEMRIGRLHDLGGGRLGSMSVSPFVFHHPGPHELVPSEEVAGIVWTPLSYLFDPANVRPYRYPRDPLLRPFPSFQYLGHPVWGLTYRMIGSFLELFGTRIPLEGEAPTDVE